MSPDNQKSKKQRVYIDLTHLGRHVTGIERIAIDLFETVQFENADVRHVRARGTLGLILKQQIWLPLLALFNPTAIFMFPGFPPSPVFAWCRTRTIWYVHDIFLMTRPDDLSRKAKLYMAPCFRFAVRRLKYFFVNSQKTADELVPFCAKDAEITLYRPQVRNVFDLSVGDRAARSTKPKTLKLVSLGTVEPRKNYAFAVAVRNALAARLGHTVVLHIIGRAGWGDEKEVVANQSDVTVHGYLSTAEVKRVLEDADLYLCTSFDEGLGLPLLEAQYAGLPVIAPDAPVFHEVLGDSGLFIPLSNADAAADLILAHITPSDWRTNTAKSSSANPIQWNARAAKDARHAQSLFAQNLADGFGDHAVSES